MDNHPQAQKSGGVIVGKARSARGAAPSGRFASPERAQEKAVPGHGAMRAGTASHGEHGRNSYTEDRGVSYPATSTPSVLQGRDAAALVSRFRSSQALAALSDAHFGIKATLATL